MRCFLALLCLLAACAGPPTPEAHEPALADAGPPPLTVGDWSSYPAADAGEWPTKPLDDDRWMLTTAELACSGRANRGDPDAHRAGARAILRARETTAEAVMDHGIAVNGDPERAQRLGERVARAVERCR